MRESAERAAHYLQENFFVAILIGLVAGYLAVQSVMPGKKGNIVLYFVLGILGAFLGQFVILYFDLKGYLDQVAGMRLLFDLLAAYIGAFVLASVIHFFRPL
jgi:uncharacterized membrane protein YeaQ/YmgE (transglycosylase-associated protein family)